jgi:hypothetical protein
MPFLAAAAPIAAAGATTAAATTSAFSLASLASYASLGAGVLGAVSAVQQGSAAQAQGKAQAGMLNQQAERERLVAQQDEEDFRNRQSRAMASRRALMGGSGIDPSSGSALLASEDMAGEIELQALKIRNNGAATSTKLQNDAGLARWAGNTERKQSFVRGGASLLQGAGYAFGRGR